VNFGKEWEHLKQHTEKDKENLNEKVIELKLKGGSLREIAAEIGISHQQVKRILDKQNKL
jgi:DNA invertase Pin-like site-specific DNA recombinase